MFVSSTVLTLLSQTPVGGRISTAETIPGDWDETGQELM